MILDLEDAVSPDQKEHARQLVADALRAGSYGDAEVAVRVNAPDTPHFDADLEAMVAAGASAIMLPKCESAAGLASVNDRLEALERRRAPRAGERTKLLCLVESPAGVADALAIGRSVARTEALCFGHADFSLQMGLAAADASRGVVYHARCSVVIAAKAANVVPIDCVHMEVRDEDAFRQDARLGLQLGFEGKLCVHPRQVEIANQVYTPTPEQIDYARRVIEAAEAARAAGRGVCTLDGKMIDAPIEAVQCRVLDRARRAGVL